MRERRYKANTLDASSAAARRSPPATAVDCGWEGIDEDDGDLHSRSDGVYRAFRTDEKDLLG